MSKSFIKSFLTRTDPSINYLRTFLSQGYAQVVFVANIIADPQCEKLNGFVYNIDELISLDNPLFRISHPNCLCEFKPYGKSTIVEESEILEPEVVEPESPKVNVPIVPSNSISSRENL